MPESSLDFAALVSRIRGVFPEAVLAELPRVR